MNFDVSFANNETEKDFRVKIKSRSFDLANQLLQESAKQDLDLIDSNHYIFDFTDDELKEVVEKQDEWSALDFLLAQKLLKERGITINKEEIETLKEQRISKLASPEKSPRFLIIFGYVLIFVGGLLGLLIGWFIRNQEKTLPNGDRIYSFAQKDRVHGERIMILGAISLLITIVLKFCSFI
ncbi:hypothetical protein [Pedobacter endophyticus]|uniref:Uncharacterized protein n=1 Tax=Pedobacter endophyticus TaxID=2789740 RepID=A0A7U3Q3D2_9SPHI|nr:hypothetical protein [Pedobacter endophyticus]QPH37779.1 hypothetical protein IZT61_11715 [Pedobacter endophyticus]